MGQQICIPSEWRCEMVKLSLPFTLRSRGDENHSLACLQGCSHYLRPVGFLSHNLSYNTIHPRHPPPAFVRPASTIPRRFQTELHAQPKLSSTSRVCFTGALGRRVLSFPALSWVYRLTSRPDQPEANSYFTVCPPSPPPHLISASARIHYSNVFF